MTELLMGHSPAAGLTVGFLCSHEQGFPGDTGLCEEWMETRMKSGSCRKEGGRMNARETGETLLPLPHTSRSRGQGA